MFRIVQSSPGEVLRTLLHMRLVLVAALSIVAVVAQLRLSLALPLAPLLVVLFVFVVWSAASYWRLRQPWMPSHLELFLNLVIDMGLFTAVLYLTGGATNPFVSFYLVTIVVAAAALPAVFAWATVLVGVSCYSLLLGFYLPLISTEASGSIFNLHVFGMWVNFLLSAVLCAVFVAGLANMARRRGEALAIAREEALRDERIVALGTFAAGVAHEMNTPLATMSLVVEELSEGVDANDSLKPSLDVLRRQVESCRKRLEALVASASAETGAARAPIPLGVFFDRLVHDFRNVRPEIDLYIERDLAVGDILVEDQPILAQAITNLLNNAADASRETGGRKVGISLSRVRDDLLFAIDDDGPGITVEELRRAGRVVHTTKRDGLGLGLLLSNASIERFGGEVSLERREGGGTRTRVRLPLADLAGSGSSPRDAGNE